MKRRALITSLPLLLVAFMWSCQEQGPAPVISPEGSTTLAKKGGGENTVFSTDFNAGVPAQFSGITTTEPVQGYEGLGTGSNVFGGDFLRNTSGKNFGGGPPPAKTTLTLTGLPAHSSVSLRFLLAIIDSWDGNSCFAGPDIFNVKVDGLLIFSEVFENSDCGTQTYVPPAGVELVRKVQLGFNPGNTHHRDAAYNMGLEPAFNDIPHTSSTLTIEWFSSGSGWQGGTDESWGIDNVEVILPTAITICHKPGTPAEKTLVIPIQALAGHLGHGDTIGPCE